MTAYDGAFWRQQLACVPTWALEQEMARRADRLGPEAVDLGELVVDPVGGRVRWRGDDYVLTGRAMEVLYALALAHRDGRLRTAPRALALAVWRGWEVEDARRSLRSYLTVLRRRFPGLIVGGFGQGRGHGLAVEAPPVRAEVA